MIKQIFNAGLLMFGGIVFLALAEWVGYEPFIYISASIDIGFETLHKILGVALPFIMEHGGIDNQYSATPLVFSTTVQILSFIAAFGLFWVYLLLAVDHLPGILLVISGIIVFIIVQHQCQLLFSC